MKQAIKLLKRIHSNNLKVNTWIEKFLAKEEKKLKDSQEQVEDKRSELDKAIETHLENETKEESEIVTFKSESLEPVQEEKPEEVDLKEFSTPDGSMSDEEKELMKVIVGDYEHKAGGGFEPGNTDKGGELPDKIWCGVCRKEHTRGTHD